MNRHSLTLVALAITALACEPPGPTGFDDGGTTTSPGSTSTTSSTTSDPDPSTSTASTSTTETETGMDPTDFVPDFDVPASEGCDSFLQDCPAGEKCVPYGSTGGNWDAFKCVTVMGDQGLGEPCTYDGTAEATDDCDENTGCWDVQDIDGEAIGTCHAFCMGSPDDPQCPEGSSCLISGSGSINYCILNCDPLIQDCGPGLACYWTNSQFNCVFTTQDIPLGDPCGFINDCAGGSACITAEVFPDCAGSACCSNWCDLDGPADQCDGLPGTECVPFFPDPDDAPPGSENVGICILP